MYQRILLHDPPFFQAERKDHETKRVGDLSCRDVLDGCFKPHSLVLTSRPETIDQLVAMLLPIQSYLLIYNALSTADTRTAPRPIKLPASLLRLDCGDTDWLGALAEGDATAGAPVKGDKESVGAATGTTGISECKTLSFHEQ